MWNLIHTLPPEALWKGNVLQLRRVIMLLKFQQSVPIDGERCFSFRSSTDSDFQLCYVFGGRRSCEHAARSRSFQLVEVLLLSSGFCRIVCCFFRTPSGWTLVPGKFDRFPGLNCWPSTAISCWWSRARGVGRSRQELYSWVTRHAFAFISPRECTTPCVRASVHNNHNNHNNPPRKAGPLVAGRGAQ